jgi:hypothetical protein
VHPADIQDRDGGTMLMDTLFGLDPYFLKTCGDGGYQGPGLGNISIEKRALACGVLAIPGADAISMLSQSAHRRWRDTSECGPA